MLNATSYVKAEIWGLYYFFQLLIFIFYVLTSNYKVNKLSSLVKSVHCRRCSISDNLPPIVCEFVKPGWRLTTILRLGVSPIIHPRVGMIRRGVKGSGRYKREAILIGSFIVVSVGFSVNFPLGSTVVRVAGVTCHSTGFRKLSSFY